MATNHSNLAYAASAVRHLIVYHRPMHRRDFLLGAAAASVARADSARPKEILYNGKIYAAPDGAGFRTIQALAVSGEKLVGAGTNTWYYIKPNGDLFRWVGATGGTGTYVRTLDTRYHTNPALLYNAHTQATYNIVGNVLTVTPSSGFVGNLVLTVFASNGTFQDIKTFIVTVS